MTPALATLIDALAAIAVEDYLAPQAAPAAAPGAECAEPVPLSPVDKAA